MALINCPECGKEVSDKAPTCPNCGVPIASKSNIQPGSIQTIEETSKRFKLITIFSVLTMIFGLVLLVPTCIGSDVEGSKLPTVAALFISIGLISYIINRIRIWWHHK